MAGAPYWQMYQSRKDRNWYWRFRAPNNETIAVGEGYNSEASCVRAMKTLHHYMDNYSQITIKRILDPNR